MSCNYCSFSRIKEDAKKSGQVVTLVPHKMIDGEEKEIDVFVHSKTLKISKKDREEIMPNHKYWEAWFMELPDKCHCGGHPLPNGHKEIR